ncbi:MAG: phosphatase PAP2 family protein [Gammaproteobacteria bacterium]|nr:phosphatase PAP2 family protein [Gammaproteobacteria bacterium]MCP5137496.1 phosphatase PAP2 family protein [Gammaproteobacteria bacterium]
MNRLKDIESLIAVPTLITVYLFALLQLGGLDDVVSGWFYDPALPGFPLQNDFWMRDVLHDDSRTVMIGVLLAVIATWGLGLVWSKFKPYRRAAGYLGISMLIGVLSVNLGKQISNTDCPWDLIPFGGDRPHILLFEAKPDDLPRGRCFPGGHSSSGFALFGLYFVSVMRGARRSWPWLLPGLIVGGTFSVAQWVRGAHFPSHDLISAYLCWMSALVCYIILIRRDKPDAT